MSELSVWDLDGTIRPGSLLAEAVLHGIQEGFIDPSGFVDPHHPTYDEVDFFVSSLINRSRADFRTITDRLSDEAMSESYEWSIEMLQEQSQNGHPIILSHSPDFLVKAFSRGLKVRHGAGSYFHTKRLVFSGRAVTLDKERSLKRYLRTKHLAGVAFAAGDSSADLPLLQSAREAYAVNPSEDLRVIAKERNWNILDISEKD